MVHVTILAEKPSQAASYADAFPNVKKQDGYYSVPPCDLLPHGANITWGYGHLVELKEPHEYNESWKEWKLEDLPIIPEKFSYRVSKSKIGHFTKVKKLLKATDEVILGTDSDREGEAIGRLILLACGCNDIPIKRLWINSLEKTEVVRGFKELKDGEETRLLFDEAQARQLSDWIVGLNGTRLYTLLLRKLGVKDTFTVGRVQIPSLKLIYDRKKAIENFKPETFYELEGTCIAQNGSYKGKYKGRFQQKTQIIELLSKHLQNHSQPYMGIVKSVEVKDKKTDAPKLHSLSSLLTLINRKFKYSPNDTLELVQSLYDAPLKLVTYPRTDSHNITENEFEYLKNNLIGYQKALGLEFTPYTTKPQKRYVDNKAVQEHYAIVLTRNIPTPEILNGLSKEQKNVYFEIAKSVFGMFHHPYRYEETKILTDLNGMELHTTGKVEKDLGWKEMYRTDPIDEESTPDEKDKTLPKVTEGEKVEVKLLEKEGKTQPPKAYTEGDLINMMITCGSDVSDEEAKSILKSVEGIGTEATRAGIIETLKKREYIQVKKNKVFVTPKGEIICKAVEGTLLSKPEMTAQWEKFLREIGKGNQSKTKFVENTKKFVQILVANAQKKISSLDLSQQIEEIQLQGVIGKCPKCGQNIVDKKAFYGCTGYKKGQEDNCKFSLPKEFLGKKISESNAAKLLDGKKTTLIKGLKGKNEKEFDAYIKLSSSGNLEFEFPKKKKKVVK
ncbi:type IA DNA topoisomerase [Bacillus cereus]|uniref:DNA topoisomerase n=1 Tax=Bacillus cereus (strain VD146) TaxID=1053236 RepID=R8MEY0_BACCX|nr:type IA DNA topoisomerase [Bacillus cereus]EOP32308.1 DNA topoisomerase III [Bacillus cereus VD146]